MSDHLTEEKNQTVDNLAGNGVALDSVATHLSKAIDLLGASDIAEEAQTLEDAHRYATQSAAHSLIALTQIFSSDPNSLSTTMPRSNSAAAYHLESPNDTEPDTTTPIDGPFRGFTTDGLKNRLAFIKDLSLPGAIDRAISELEAELARRESVNDEIIEDWNTFQSRNAESLQARKTAGNEYVTRPLTWSEQMDTSIASTPFENPEVVFPPSITSYDGITRDCFTRDELVQMLLEYAYTSKERAENHIDAFLAQKEAP